MLDEENERRLVAGAAFLGEKSLTDAYYDAADRRLTLRDFWLRKRDDAFELKVPLNESLETRVSDQYRELDEEPAIAAAIGLRLGAGQPLAEALAAAGFAPFCTIITTRRKYKNGDFSIDIDSTDFGHRLAEIELMIADDADEAAMKAAAGRILAFAERLGVRPGKVIGKVAAFLKIKDPAHFQALIDAKVIRG